MRALVQLHHHHAQPIISPATNNQNSPASACVFGTTAVCFVSYLVGGRVESQVPKQLPHRAQACDRPEFRQTRAPKCSCMDLFFIFLGPAISCLLASCNLAHSVVGSWPSSDDELSSGTDQEEHNTSLPY